MSANLKLGDGSSMGNPRIALPVDDDAGRAYASASPEEKRKIQFLLRLRLRELTTTPTRPLREVLEDVGAKAEARGLTPEILASLLRGR
jgi:hypothetical protein